MIKARVGHNKADKTPLAVSYILNAYLVFEIFLSEV